MKLIGYITVGLLALLLMIHLFPSFELWLHRLLGWY